MIPALLLLSGFVIAWVSKSNREQALLRTRPTVSLGAVNAPSSLHTLRRILQTSKRPPKWLVNDAMREAFDNGDIHVVGALAIAFQTQSPEPESEESEETPPQSDTAPSENPGLVSPIDGATAEEWGLLTEQLKTESPDFQSGKHVGAFRQNVERLQMLGIEPPGNDLSAQTAAISADLADYTKTQLPLIRDACGDIVVINGQSHGVTMSGVLGLLKAAGPSGARAWLRDERERSSFPKTTETFLRTNGIF